MAITKLQLGKKGISENFLETLKNHFQKNKDIKISVLKSAGRENLKKFEGEILNTLGKNYTSRTIGFTINLKKWRKARI